MGTSQSLQALRTGVGASGKLTCGLGTLAAGEEAEIAVVAIVPADVQSGAILESGVSVASDTPDPNNANDAAGNLTTVSAVADLALIKQQSPAFVVAGEQVEYTLNVRNSGPSDAPGAVVSDTLPAAITGATWTCEPFNGGTCPTSGEGSLRHSVGLPVGAELVYTVRGVRDPVSGGQIIVNKAEILAPRGVADCNLANNADTVINEQHTVYVPLISKGRSPVQAPDLVVESITATSSGVEVTIMNRGALPVVDAFWVDVYLDPVRPPAQVNETWDDLASMGLVWGVNRAALPLEPGQTLTLVVGDGYYAGSLSYVVWPLPVGMVVYAQVDSVGNSEYGAVREAHEISGGFYNNIGGPVTVVAGSGQPPLSTDADLPDLEGLPPR